MARKANTADDEWHNVTDLKKRKQIQDRLAQRARRKRLREAKDNAKQTSSESSSETRSQDDDSSSSLATVSDTVPYFSTLCSFSFASTSVDMAEISASVPLAIGLGMQKLDENGILPFSDYPVVVPESITPNPTFPMTVYSALYMNGQILGLSCSTTVPAKSTPVCADIPLTLHPTSLQITTIHARWIDRLPSPKARDNLISMSGIVDEEEILRDIFCMPSFDITPGMVPWDPQAWKIVKCFEQKWGFVFV